MISLTFAKFFRGEFEDEGYDLYMVKEADRVMYIGISRVSVWHRWFGGLSSHMDVAPGERLRGNSTIGEVIERRLPASWNWMIELWTKEDCCRALKEELNSLGVVELPIIDLEALLIQRFAPPYNATDGGGAQQDPLISKALDEAYRKIFEK